MREKLTIKEKINGTAKVQVKGSISNLSNMLFSAMEGSDAVKKIVQTAYLKFFRGGHED